MQHAPEPDVPNTSNNCVGKLIVALVDVCSPLGEGLPNVGRALGCKYVDNLKTCQRGHNLTRLARWDYVGTTLGIF